MWHTMYPLPRVPAPELHGSWVHLVPVCAYPWVHIPWAHVVHGVPRGHTKEDLPCACIPCWWAGITRWPMYRCCSWTWVMVVSLSPWRHATLVLSRCHTIQRQATPCLTMHLPMPICMHPFSYHPGAGHSMNPFSYHPGVAACAPSLVIQVLGTACAPSIGGREYDNAIVHHLTKIFKEQSGVEATPGHAAADCMFHSSMYQDELCSWVLCS